MTDPQFRTSVLLGGALVVVLVMVVRFCGSVAIPPKPPPPQGPSGTATQLLSKSTTSPAAYARFLESDAAEAGVRAPTIDEMARKLVYRVDEARHVLELGKPPIELAGLKLHLERSGDVVTLIIRNTTASDLGYEVSTMPSWSGCNNASPLPFNANVIAKGTIESRVECSWRDGMTIAVTKVETFEVSPLESWYLGAVPPQILGIEDRIARGHRSASKVRCSAVASQVVRTGIERGEIGWRDLADFYSRHRCQTYEFPPSYRAFNQDGQRQLPVVDSNH